MPPEFVVVGHAVRDVAPDGWQLGGTVSFAAVQAHRLGLSVGVVTRAAEDIDVAAALPFAHVVCRPADVTTSFENVYIGGVRTQHILARAPMIEPSDVPEDWRAARIVLLGPVFGELAADFAATFASSSRMGVSAQGWLRSSDSERRVQHTGWDGPPFWEGADVLFVSDEDLTGESEMERWLAEVPVIAMTESWRGARVFAGGRWRRMEAFPEIEVDPTGAGDTFATAFLIRLHESADVDDAARFGAAAASLSVGGIGSASIPTRTEIEERMERYPDVALR